MVMYDDATAVTMPVDALTSTTAAILESIPLERPNEFSNRKIPKLLDHRVTATAGLSITSIFPASTGIDSPASIMSST